MEKTEILVFDVDFNDVTAVDGRDCVAGSASGAVVGDRVVANDDAEKMTVPGEVMKLDGAKVWIRLDWFEGLG